MVLLAVSGFQIAAWTSHVALKLFAVCLISVQGGAGEITFLAMSSHYDPVTISTWSAGTGLAGFFGSLSYLALTNWLALQQKWALTIITPFPLLILVATYFIMTGEHRGRRWYDTTPYKIMDDEEYSPIVSTLSFKEKLIQSLKLYKFMIPLFLVYFAEYLINQGVSPTLTFPNSEIEGEYTYYQFMYVLLIIAHVDMTDINLVFY